MRRQLSLFRANVDTNTWQLKNLLHAASGLQPTSPGSASKKTNAKAPIKDNKRGRRPLPRDANGKIIRPPVVENKVKIVKNKEKN